MMDCRICKECQVRKGKKCWHFAQTEREYDKNLKLMKFKHYCSCLKEDYTLYLLILSSIIWFIPWAIICYIKEKTR